MDFYRKRLDAFNAEKNALRQKYNIISIARLIIAGVFIILAYYCFMPGDNSFLYFGMLLCAALFFVLMKVHSTVTAKRARAEAMVKINTDEINFLEGKSVPFADGDEFKNFKHPFSYDLDIFGDKSLYHYLNRTETYRGGQMLAELLNLPGLNNNEIAENQQAIAELKAMPEFRQEISAFGNTGKDNKNVYLKIIEWAKKPVPKINKLATAIAFIAPSALWLCIFIYIFTGEHSFFTAAEWIIGFNLAFAMSHFKQIKAHTSDTTELHSIIKNYGLTINEIEQQSFSSDKLSKLQHILKQQGESAGFKFKKLGRLFEQMDTAANVLATIILNGLFLYHFHIFLKLIKWKNINSGLIEAWLSVIGEFESLSSLANFSYNNKGFTFPELNTDYHIEFKELVHPLLKPESSIGNNITFKPQFVILTGSNMSGKSTFLRSLGINMVLAGIGSVVCAPYANIHPLPVLVSMRLSDSLSDNESYFFAEIKRLRQIMDALIKERAFVLLDEILRGTNSDDKQTGTIKVIEKMVAHKAIGAIATHDIEVCNTTLIYPDDLVNCCFEAEISNNELYFDYKLRKGVCKNKSATFLMEKTGVI